MTRAYAPPRTPPDRPVPILRPGLDRLPSACPACRSRLLDVEPSSGSRGGGIVTCVACGAVLAYLLPALPPKTGRRGPRRGR